MRALADEAARIRNDARCPERPARVDPRARPETITRASLSRYPAAELQGLAQVLGTTTPATGRPCLSAILAAVRLRGYLAGATVGWLKKLPARELRRWLKSIGQYAPASRYGLAAALIDWRDRCRAEGRARWPAPTTTATSATRCVPGCPCRPGCSPATRY